jgi:transcriptional regulator GlxA family with amidase domain
MTNPRNVAILVFDDIEVLDFAGPYEVFNVASELVKPTPFYVFNLGISDRPVIGRGKFTVTPRYTIDDCPQPDILIIPGGFGTRPLVKHEKLIRWLASQEDKVELLLSVCTGALLLAQAGILDNCPATTHHGAYDRLAQLAPTATVVRDQRFVQSNAKVITSGGISAGIDMSLHVVETLLGSEAKAKVVEEMEYAWFQTTSPS